MTFAEFVATEDYAFCDMDDRAMRAPSVLRAIAVRLATAMEGQGRGRGHILVTRGRRRLVEALEAHDVPTHVHGDVAEAMFKDLRIAFPPDRSGHHLAPQGFTTRRAEDAACAAAGLGQGPADLWTACETRGATTGANAHDPGKPVLVRGGDAGLAQLQEVLEDAATLLQDALEPMTPMKRFLQVHVERAGSLAGFAIATTGLAFLSSSHAKEATQALWEDGASTARVAHALDHAIAHLRPTCLAETRVEDRVAAHAEIEPRPSSTTLQAALHPKRQRAAARIGSFLVRTGADAGLLDMYGVLDTHGALDMHGARTPASAP